MDKIYSQQKWKAKVSTKLEKARPDQIWPLFGDFFGLHKWFPGLPTCYGVHGVNGDPGCIRRCSGFGLKRPQEINGDDSTLSWSEEKLVSIDHDRMSLTYEMVDSNIGFNCYVSTVEVVPAAEGAAAAVEWWISLDPVAGWKLEDLVEMYQVGMQLMVGKMEDAVLRVV
ncbi:hypothetical protein ACS0TY_012314 [Phlomoides rotata]